MSGGHNCKLTKNQDLVVQSVLVPNTSLNQQQDRHADRVLK
ncbi:hypothetical protein EOK76_g1972 [Lacticaseibacillus paracasei]|nr:hypothetical protein EOK76_g1972 [Lacticaseibacillus paracasei]